MLFLILKQKTPRFSIKWLSFDFWRNIVIVSSLSMLIVECKRAMLNFKLLTRALHKDSVKSSAADKKFIDS